MPPPYVTGVTFRGGQIVLTVELDGFLADKPVEISGCATQNSGGFALFNSIQSVPANPLGTVVMYVKATPYQAFRNGEPVTVALRAATMWVAVLTEGLDGPVSTAQPETPARGTTAVDGTAWNIVKEVGYPTATLEQRDGPLSASRPHAAPTPNGLYHGTWWYRHQQDSRDSPETVMAGRFTTLLPKLSPAVFDLAHLQLLADEMTSRQERQPTPKAGLDPEEDPDITAAYTYLGQFVDHDLSFDPTSHLREFLDRAQIEKLADFRTPRFDLDNLYGRGPDDQPYMYAPDGIRMLLGEPLSGNPEDPHAVQVPRGPNGRALIGDPRDDENRIVSQLHSIFLRFHNRVADHMGANASFEEVRDQVRHHYQWMVVKDFLPTVLEGETYERVFGDPYNPVPGLQKLRRGLRLMPVEFSVAAYRFGHSMIRPEYRLNAAVERPVFSSNPGDTADLSGFRPIPDGWAIDWRFFIDLGPRAMPAATALLSDPVVPRPQHAFKIDTSLASPLGSLPPRVASDPSILALRDLERGNTFRLPSGQDVARALGVVPIPDEKLVIGKATAEAGHKLLVDIASEFADRAPLWAYVLIEAQVMSWEKADPGTPKDDIPIKLGPVGSRIIADVFAALLIGDRTSYLYRDPQFRPIQEFTHNGRFGLAELINAALRPPP